MNDAHSLYCILVMAGLVRAIHVRAIHASPQARAGRRHVDARNKFAHDERGPGHSLRRSAAVAVAALGLLAGCTYLDQRQDLMQGGPWNRIATANTSLQRAKETAERITGRVDAVEPALLPDLGGAAARMFGELVSRGPYTSVRYQSVSITCDCSRPSLLIL